MVYFPTPENVTNIGEMFGYLNVLTSDYFGVVVLLTFWVMLFALFLYRGPENALAGSLFIITIIGYVFVVLHVISVNMAPVLTLVLGLSVLLLFFGRD